MKLEVRAPAKINWTLEVLARRPDGYHEVRTILQTIGLADTVTLRAADEITLSIAGDGGALAGGPVERNLAYRAALLLRGEAKRGVQIELEKRIPIAAGLGGGSSDAAAVLRGLRKLWAITVSDAELAAMAAELGSDVPFLLRGGTAIASGRGEIVEALPDIRKRTLLVAWPQGAQDANKTASMYGALRAEHYTDGTATEALAARIRKGKKVAEQDIYNVFGLAPTPEGTRSRRSAERLSAQTPPMTTLRLTTQPAPGMKRARSETRRTTTSSSSHLCGSGPAFFFLARSDEHAAALADGLRDMGLEVRQTTTIAAPEALSITKLS